MEGSRTRLSRRRGLKTRRRRPNETTDSAQVDEIKENGDRKQRLLRRHCPRETVFIVGHESISPMEVGGPPHIGSPGNDAFKPRWRLRSTPNGRRWLSVNTLSEIGAFEGKLRLTFAYSGITSCRYFKLLPPRSSIGR